MNIRKILYITMVFMLVAILGFTYFFLFAIDSSDTPYQKEYDITEPKQQTTDCGNGICQEGESCTSCSEDCECTEGFYCDTKDDTADENGCVEKGNAAYGSFYCGDGTCSTDETCLSCAQDCACQQGQICTDLYTIEKGCIDVTDPDQRAHYNAIHTYSPDDYSMDNCGDEICQEDEMCFLCPADCGCKEGYECTENPSDTDNGCVERGLLS